MLPVTAMDAPEHLSLAGQRIDAPTGRARLRAVGGVNLRQLPPLPCQLVGEEFSEQAPTLIEDASGEPSVSPHHVADLKVLDHDGAVALGVVVTELVTEVFPLPPNLSMQVGDTKLCFLSVLGSFLPLRNGALCAGESLEGLAVEVRGLEEQPVRVRDHVRYASVDGNDGLDLRKGVGNFNLADNRGEPLIAVSLERAGFGVAFDGSVNDGSKVAELWKTNGASVQPPSFRVRLTKPEEVSSSLLPSRSPHYALETTLPSLVEFNEKLSTHVSRNISQPRKLFAKLGQFVDLVEGGWKDPLISWAGVAHLPLLKSEVPQPAKSTFPFSVPLDLSFSRIDAVAERLTGEHRVRLPHQDERRRAVPPRPEGRGFSAEI
jgi:hypothetical protein